MFCTIADLLLFVFLYVMMMMMMVTEATETYW